MRQIRFDGYCAGQFRSGGVAGLVWLVLSLPAMVVIEGCGGSAQLAGASVQQQGSTLSLQPGTANIEVGQSVQFSVTGNSLNAACTWQSSQPSVLSSLGGEQFQGTQTGTSQVVATCGSLSATASVVVAAQQPSGPIQITKGGTYSGNWTSTDPNTPAVTVSTDESVILQNSVITGRGTLISVSGVKTGAHLTVENVTGTALDPEVAGMPRGIFLLVSNVTSLVVRNCSMYGVSFGVRAIGGTPTTLEILNNLARNLEDRASDGQGGFQSVMPALGHFVILDKITAPNGAEIAWNQVVQTMGQSSTEDVINIYHSQGTPAHPIWVHDNYMEGYSSPATGANYDGAGLISDGSINPQVTAYVLFQDNEMVHMAGSGVAIAAGHDITATGNRIVSCGQDSSGTWFAMSFVNATALWNSYQDGEFYNNTITGSVGGVVRPSANNTPMIADTWAGSTSLAQPGNSITENNFTDPCLINGVLNLKAEDDERAFWSEKVAAAGEIIGNN